MAVLDLDSQKNLSRTFAQHLYEISAARLFAAGLPGGTPTPRGLYLSPGESELTDLERASRKVIRDFLNNVAQLSAHFDYCLIDTPPANCQELKWSKEQLLFFWPSGIALTCSDRGRYRER